MVQTVYKFNNRSIQTSVINRGQTITKRNFLGIQQSLGLCSSIHIISNLFNKHHGIIYQNSGKLTIFLLNIASFKFGFSSNICFIQSCLIYQHSMTIDPRYRYRCIWKQPVQSIFNWKFFYFPVVLIPSPSGNKANRILLLKFNNPGHHLIETFGAGKIYPLLLHTQAEEMCMSVDKAGINGLSFSINTFSKFIFFVQAFRSTNFKKFSVSHGKGFSFPKLIVNCVDIAIEDQEICFFLIASARGN